MIVLYIAIAGTVLLMSTALFATWRYAPSRTGSLRNEAITHHVLWANRSLGAVLGAVLLIEIAVLLAGSGEHRDILPYHLPFALTFLLLLVLLRWWITGATYPRLHKVFAYTCLGCFVAVLGTGIYLFIGMGM